MMTDTGANPITHNERFTHFVFPRLVFGRRKIWFDVLRSEQGTESVREVWELLGRKIVDAGEGPAIPSAGVNARPIDAPTVQGAVVSFPFPTRVTGCHMIGLLRPIRRRWLGIRPDALPRYFTFERVDDPVGEAVLGEWTFDAHINYGRCAGCSEDVFLTTVTDVLSGNRKASIMHRTSRFKDA
jgi:hypothetical protein